MSHCKTIFISLSIFVPIPFSRTKNMKRSLSLRVQILIHRKRFFLHFRCKYLAAEGFQGARKLTKRIRTDQRGESISELRDYIGRGANTRIGKSAANGKSLKYTHTTPFISRWHNKTKRGNNKNINKNQMHEVQILKSCIAKINQFKALNSMLGLNVWNRTLLALELIALSVANTRAHLTLSPEIR